MKKPVLILVIAGLLLAFLVSACGGGKTAPTANPPVSSGGGSTEPTGSSSVEPANTQPTAEPASPAQRIPEDLPIMEGATNLDVVSDGSNVKYQIEGDVNTVMTFYQENLPQFGWEPTRSPDSAIGAIGTMSRQNTAGDKLSVNMQYNKNGGFVIVQIAMVRSQKK